MDLGLTETQQLLRNTAKEFLETECPSSYVREMEQDERGYTPEMWQKIADQGWLGLAFPEEYDGAGLDFVDLAILLEEMGRYMLPGPFFATVVMGGMAILEGGSEAQKKEYLSQIAQGQIIVTLALTEPSGRWDAAGVETTAEKEGDDWVLSGVKLFTPYAHICDYLLVVARTGAGAEDISMFMAPRSVEGASQTLLKTIASDRQSEVVFEDARLPGSALIGELNGAWPIMEKVKAYGAVGKCAELSGATQQVLDMTVEYAKGRLQFGRPIGSFQAIQHHCANMAIDVEGSKYITYQAAWALADGHNASREVSLAKAWVSDASKRVCATGHQCHGAIGFTTEHDMQLFSRRAKAAELMFGDGDYHKEIVADMIGL